MQTGHPVSVLILSPNHIQNAVCDIIIALSYVQTTNLNVFCIVVTNSEGTPMRAYTGEVCNYDPLIALVATIHIGTFTGSAITDKDTIYSSITCYKNDRNTARLHHLARHVR